MKSITEHAEIIECGSREAWLAERRKSIGASESPAILGESPYASALSVWADKTTPALVNGTTERQQLGLDLEPIVLAAYRRKYGGQIDRWDQNTLARSKSHPYLHCTPDAIVYEPTRDGPGVCQVKTWSEFDQRAWQDSCPLHVQIQVQHEMVVTGCHWGVVPVLFGSSRLERYYIDRNERFIEAMLGVLADFATCLELRVPPAVDGSAATARALARLHPNDSGDAILLPAESLDALDTLRRSKDLRKRLDDQIGAAENQLKAAIGDATYGMAPDGRWVSWKSQSRKAYTVAESTFRVLRECKAPKGIEPVECDYKVDGRRTIPRSVKLRLLSQHPHCKWCGATLTLATATIEHVVPLAVGGTNDEHNLALACATCNQKRGSDATLATTMKG